MNFKLSFAGIDFCITPRYSDTIRYFPQAVALRLSSSGCETIDCVAIDDFSWELYLSQKMEPTAHTEFSMLTPHCSDALLKYDRVILHAVALRWRDRAWLICAPSGTGKSTQAKTLQALHPGEFGIICGDRPILQFCHPEPRRDGTLPSAASLVPPCHSERSEAESKNPSSLVLVHPSPWNGKENWHGAEAAPLAGIILLTRGEKNSLAAIDPKDAAAMVFNCFITTAQTENIIHKLASLETALLQSVPIWYLTTHEVPDSTKLLLESVFS